MSAAAAVFTATKTDIDSRVEAFYWSRVCGDREAQG
jgi:hypothetical protein